MKFRTPLVIALLGICGIAVPVVAIWSGQDSTVVTAALGFSATVLAGSVVGVTTSFASASAAAADQMRLDKRLAHEHKVQTARRRHRHRVRLGRRIEAQLTTSARMMSELRAVAKRGGAAGQRELSQLQSLIEMDTGPSGTEAVRPLIPAGPLQDSFDRWLDACADFGNFCLANRGATSEVLIDEDELKVLQERAVVAARTVAAEVEAYVADEPRSQL